MRWSTSKSNKGLNTYPDGIVPYLSGILGIRLSKQFMLTIPIQLIEAATVVGCSPWWAGG